MTKDRRDLLKQAALAAPLIATLPSGAVWANASSYQCVAQDATRTPNPAVPAADEWLRLAATVVDYSHGNETATVYELPDGSLWLPDGSEFDPQGWRRLDSTAAPTNVLELFSTSPLRVVGVWPQYRTDEYQGLTGSCLTSVHPGEEPWSI